MIEIETPYTPSQTLTRTLERIGCEQLDLNGQHIIFTPPQVFPYVVNMLAKDEHERD